MTNVMDQLLGMSQQDHLRTLSKVPPTLSFREGICELAFEAINLSTFEAAKQMPGGSRWDGKTLRFKAHESSIAYVKRTWSNVIILKPQVPRAAKPLPDIVEVEGALRWVPRHPPFEHQRIAFNLGIGKRAFAYLMDMGTGKTKAAIDDAAFQFSNHLIDRVLVIAPNGVHEQWIDDALPVHWPLALGAVRYAIRTGDSYIEKGKKVNRRPDWYPSGAGAERDCKWLAVNIENLKARKIKQGGIERWVLEGLAAELEAFVKAGRCMIILDESHKTKNPMAKRTKACQILAKSATFKRILTGSPIAKGVEDYYSQFKFLDPTIIGCHTMAGFKQQFCIMGGFDKEEIVGYRSMDEFHRRISPFSYRVEKDDVLDLPPKMYMERFVEMTPEQRRVYNELKVHLETELSDGTVLTVDQITTRMLRFQQVVMGFLPREDGTVERFPTNRMTALRDLIEQAPGRVVIWCRFHQDIDDVLAELGDEAVQYDGRNKAQRPEIKREWLMPGSRKRYFVGNAQAGGTGLDWINGASTVIYYSNSFASIDRWQSEDRTHRIGTKGTVSYYDIICRATVDKAIIANLRGKRDVSAMSLTELKELVG